MTNFHRHGGAESNGQQQPQQPYGWFDPAAYPQSPAYAPVQPPEGHARRAGRPAALLVAVALAAAVVGGGAASLVEQLAGNGGGGTGGPGVSGAPVAASSRGTVTGVAAAVSPAIVEINATSDSGKATGAGVIITSGGEVVTNNHVIAGASAVSVRLSTGRTYTAQVVGADPGKDLALIKLKGASGLKTASFGDSSQLRVGDEVVAIGSPEGLSGTVTSGIVSALDRDVTVAKEQGQNQSQEQQGGVGDSWPFRFGGQQFNGDTGESTTTYKAIQTDASLNPGNSGGALLNMAGQVIGINSAIYSAGSGSSAGADSAPAGSVGLGFAIPVNTVKADLGALRAGGGN
ncbi:S1C family serine protease [Streptomyces sp. NPDC088725]|uniref:S1C family serine protease n=1 Tax=Streptomyces sp. NPDC088725 TaxID=3365873 RepID=UPI003812D629